MNKKKCNLIRAIIWLAAISLFLGFAWNYFSFGGHFHYEHDFERKSGFVSRFYSVSNYEIAQNEKTYIKIFKTPTAFNLKTPNKFEKATIKIRCRSDQLDEFRFGAVADRGKSVFDLRPVKIDRKNQWIEKEVNIDLTRAFYHPKDKYGFVFVFEDGELQIEKIVFDLHKKNLWKNLWKK